MIYFAKCRLQYNKQNYANLAAIVFGHFSSQNLMINMIDTDTVGVRARYHERGCTPSSSVCEHDFLKETAQSTNI